MQITLITRLAMSKTLANAAIPATHRLKQSLPLSSKLPGLDFTVASWED
jgi:hypothetical protein